MSSKKGFGFQNKDFEEYAGALFGDSFGKKRPPDMKVKPDVRGNKSNRQSPTFDIIIGSAVTPTKVKATTQEMTFTPGRALRSNREDDFTDLSDDNNDATPPLPFEIIVDTKTPAPSAKSDERVFFNMSGSAQPDVESPDSCSPTGDINPPSTARNVFIEIPPTTEKKGILKQKGIYALDPNIDNDSDYASLDNGEDRKWMTNEDSVSLSGSDLDFFCVDHMKLCSSRSGARSHSKCREVIPNLRTAVSRSSGSSGDSWSSGRGGRKSTMSRNAYLFYASSMERMYEYAGTILEEREELKQRLKRRREDMAEELYGFMEDLITRVLTLKKELVLRLETHHRSTLTKINQQVKRLHKLRHETRVAWQRIQFSSNVDNDIKEETIHNTMSRSQVLKEILLGEYNACDRFAYGHRPNSGCRKLLTLDSVGKVVVNHFTSELPPFLSVVGDEGSDTSSKTREPEPLHFIAILENSDTTSKHDSCFSGCAFATPDDIVMTDWTNSAVKVFNKFGVLQDKLETGHSPWDVTQTTNGQVAVTVPKEHTVYILECSPQLQIASKFDTCYECWGIVSMPGKFAITCDPWSLAPSVRIFSDTGDELCCFQNNSAGENMFKCPLHVGTDVFGNVMYVSDASTDAVVALSLDGDIRFVYGHPELRYPTGIVSDRHNHIYICSRETITIQKLSESGKLLETIARRGNGLESPRAVAFHPHGQHMLITDMGSEHCNGYFDVSVT